MAPDLALVPQQPRCAAARAPPRPAPPPAATLSIAIPATAEHVSGEMMEGGGGGGGSGGGGGAPSAAPAVRSGGGVAGDFMFEDGEHLSFKAADTFHEEFI